MLEQVVIRNFRSIETQQIDVKKLTVLVGANDAGKSNVLRALNLFFNNQVDLDQEFVFERDFNQFTKTRSKTAREVSVELRIRLPRAYLRHQKAKHIVWRKSWRGDSSNTFSDTYSFVGGKKLASASKIPLYLSRYKYTYVPAIKDRTFFSDLQGQMYDVLASVAAQPLRASAQQFEKQLQVQLDGLLQLLANFEKSSVSLPESLRQIFESLEINSGGIPLSRRGDGIKIRHIPKLLRFISSKQDEILNRGRVRYTHIWGFEEPENNVEMSSSFEMADELVKIIEEEENHQLFITTHSPIFYRIGDAMRSPEKSLETLFVEKIPGASTSIGSGDYRAIDQKMGLMPLVAPYVQEAKAEFDKLRGQLEVAKRLADQRVPTLFVEGETDRKVFELAFAHFRELSGPIEIFSGGEDYGSANALASRALAWLLIMRHRPVSARTKALALFDQDDAGIAARTKLTGDMTKLAIQNLPQFKVEQVPAAENIREMRQRGYLVPVDLESLYIDEVWLVAEDKGWLEDRVEFQTLIRKDLVQQMFETNKNPLFDLSAVQQIRLKRKFSHDGKNKVIGYIKSKTPAEQKTMLQNFCVVTKLCERELVAA